MKNKSNPLFVDSTVLHGDRIATQIELKDVLLYDGESLLVVLTNHLGEVQHISLKLGDNEAYFVRVWLAHQKAMQFRFIIEKEGRVLFRSKVFHARAQYLIQESWQVLLNDDTPEETLPKPMAVLAQPPSLNRAYSSRTAEAGATIGALIEKWGF